MTKSIQQYIIEHTIGEGSYSKVKRCHNTLNGSYYAIKIFNKLILEKKKKKVRGHYVSDFE